MKKTFCIALLMLLISAPAFADVIQAHIVSKGEYDANSWQYNLDHTTEPFVSVSKTSTDLVDIMDSALASGNLVEIDYIAWAGNKPVTSAEEIIPTPIEYSALQGLAGVLTASLFIYGLKKATL